jgi:hypothetical protein
MARNVRLLLIGWEAVLVAVSVVLLASGAPWAPLVIAYALLNAGIVLTALLLERPRYGGRGRRRRDPHEEAPGALERTEEVFIDPTTGTRMRVWVDSGSGERSYRAEPD